MNQSYAGTVVTVLPVHKSSRPIKCYYLCFSHAKMTQECRCFEQQLIPYPGGAFSSGFKTVFVAHASTLMDL